MFQTNDSDYESDESDYEEVIVRNYKCTKNFLFDADNHKIIRECARKVKHVMIEKILGRGTFGTVYLADLIDEDGQNVKVAIKRIEIKRNKFNIDELMYEVEYSYFMAEIGVGPKIYDAFYIELRDTAVQYIFMEAGEGSIGDAIESDMNPKLKEAIVRDSIRLTWKQIEHDMFCLDIKPGNFIYQMIGKNPRVKMIDFGKDWCSLGEIPLIFKDMSRNYGEAKKHFFAIVMTQLLFLIEKKIAPQFVKNARTILRPFFDNKILKNYFLKPRELGRLIKAILDHDPGISHIFKWYVIEPNSKKTSTEVAKYVINSIENFTEMFKN